jgi:hypothetical protein
VLAFRNTASAKIDGCIGLIISRATSNYYRLPEEHKRWIDPEDLIQEGMLAALQTDGFDKNKGSKYSTYLYNALLFHFSKRYQVPLRQQKRTAYLIELDAPLGTSQNFRRDGGDEKTQFLQLPDTESDHTRAYNATAAFLEMCDYLSAPAIEFLAAGLLCGNWTAVGKRSNAEPSLIKEISLIVKKQQVGIDSLRMLFKSEESRKMALKALGTFGSIGLGVKLEAKILECVSCQGLFNLNDIGKGRYVVETMTCRACYRKLIKAPPEISCFGKVKTENTQGYLETDIECRMHCRDRKVCRRQIMENNMTSATPSTKGSVDELEDVDLSEVEAAPKPKKTAKKAAKVAKAPVPVEPTPEPKKPAKKAAKAPDKAAEKTEKPAKPAKEAKPAKPAKVAKPKKELSEEEAKDVKFLAKHSDVCGPRLPHKAGSNMRYAFCRALEGVKAATLKSEIDASGHNYDIYLKVLRNGHAGRKRPTHTWKLDETGGFLKLDNVKYVGPAVVEEAEEE